MFALILGQIVYCVGVVNQFVYIHTNETPFTANCTQTIYLCCRYIRVRPRFFDQIGHETMYASSGNKHFFTKPCHRQTYQNYEQSQQKLGTILGNKVS